MTLTLKPIGHPPAGEGLAHTTHLQADEIGCWFFVEKEHDPERARAALRRWLTRWATRQGVTPLWGVERYVFKPIDPLDPWPGWPNDGRVIGSVGVKTHFRLEKEWLKPLPSE